MDPARRYAVSLPGQVGSHRPSTVVIVHWTPRTVGGRTVYADHTGTFQVTIDADGVAAVVDGDVGHQYQCLHTVPLPEPRSAA
ncbi:hypothetical protein C7C46_04755 [Streptomyces tateyamensis]|uniref:Uncharacterized protein n=1 Tax=Streptomyces tateyamensis TaxID=565073 RepID=A0A2V4P956_9ACTN|nr:DUF6296 family protein [Streptomyces tateyamensis]PYC87394.1 hypothetical protein C7C46_04755 [Streptomyces tateyamensis]